MGCGGFILMALVLLSYSLGFAEGDDGYMYTPEEWAELTGTDPYAEEDSTGAAEDEPALPVYGSILDPDGSPESLRDQASSGFDVPGALALEESEAVYEDSTGSIVILVPEVSPPVAVDE
ncbi:MAG TPA: hypothetical protein PK274_10120 [Candidatus Fermentibacter daniensis]|nr:hypothetical protein [Candidatus Fermentibacter daniensis]